MSNKSNNYFNFKNYFEQKIRVDTALTGEGISVACIVLVVGKLSKEMHCNVWVSSDVVRAGQGSASVPRRSLHTRKTFILYGNGNIYMRV